MSSIIKAELLARFRKGGYIFDIWIGDHDPKHFHVFDSKGNFLGRFNIENMSPIGKWQPSKKIVKYIVEIVQENELL